MGKGHLDLKIGGALPSLQYHVQRSGAVPGAVEDIVEADGHLLVRWRDSVSHGRGVWGGEQASYSSQGQDITKEGLCLLEAHSLRTLWLHSSDAARACTGRVEACLEGLAPLVWSQTHLFAQSACPSCPP